MEPQELYDENLDIDFEDDVDCEAEDWDEEALGFDFDHADTDSIAREIGLRR